MHRDYYNNPTRWLTRPLLERLEAIRLADCTGPCGQSSSVHAARRCKDQTLLDAIAELKRPGALATVVHPKKGDEYEVLDPGPRGAVINTTNGPNDGQRMVLYRSRKDRQYYVREEGEFREPGHFVPLTPPQEA